jgi:hypothetical protein
MRSIFLSNSANLPSDITGQIEALNSIVVDWCVNDIYGEAQSYLRFREDLTTLAEPMEKPKQNDRDYKELEFKGFF